MRREEWTTLEKGLFRKRKCGELLRGFVWREGTKPWPFGVRACLVRLGIELFYTSFSSNCLPCRGF